MREYRFEEYIRNRPKFTRIRLKFKGLERAFRKYPRERDEERVLIQLARARWKRWLEEGKIERVKERRYTLKPE